MRCRICNTKLRDSELSKKDSRGNFLETCGNCMASVYESLDDFTLFLKDIEKPLDTD